MRLGRRCVRASGLAGEPAGDGAVLIAHLGRVWAGTTAEHESRCVEQGIPPERATTAATRPELARRMLERALNACAPFTYFLADERG